jgi:hypothetical protein
MHLWTSIAGNQPEVGVPPGCIHGALIFTSAEQDDSAQEVTDVIRDRHVGSNTLFNIPDEIGYSLNGFGSGHGSVFLY